MSMLFVTGGGKNKNKRKINHFYFYFVLPKVRVGSPVKHFIKNKRPDGCAKTNRVVTGSDAQIDARFPQLQFEVKRYVNFGIDA